MSRTQRILAVALSGVLLLSAFALGRASDTLKTNAEENRIVSNQTAVRPALGGETQKFYASDYKTGYADGCHAALDEHATSNVVNTARVGYNDGYKQGFADAFRERAEEVAGPPAPATTRVITQQVAYRPVTYRARARSRHSKLRTALTIAAPAAIGAGIGVAAGGKRGAAAGALLGGGGGALYHLFKDRR